MSLKSHRSVQDLTTTTTLEEQPNKKPIEHIGEPGTGPPYFDWKEVYPELQLLKDNFGDIVEEAKTIHHVSFLFSYTITFFSGFHGLKITLQKME